MVDYRAQVGVQLFRPHNLQSIGLDGAEPLNMRQRQRRHDDARGREESWPEQLAKPFDVRG